MDPRKLMNTRNTKPLWNRNGNMMRFPPQLALMWPRFPAPSLPSLPPESSPNHCVMPLHIPAPLPQPPGFVSILPQYRVNSAVPMVVLGNTPMTPSSTGGMISSATPYSYASSSSLYSPGLFPPPVRSAALPQVWSVNQQAPTQYLGPQINVCYPIPPMAAAAPTPSELQAVTSSSLRESNLGRFYPVGMVMNTQSSPTIPFMHAVSHPVGRQTQNSSISNSLPWTTDTSYGSWSYGNNGQVRSYSQSALNNIVQPSCRMYPVSHTYTIAQACSGIRQWRNYRNRNAKSHVPFHVESPPQPLLQQTPHDAGSSIFPHFHNESQCVNNDVQHISSADNNRSTYQEDSGENSVSYSSSTPAGSITTSSTMMVSANDSSPFKASLANTSFQTEQGLPLQDAKIQLTESAPPSLYSSFCSLEDKLLAQPTPSCDSSEARTYHGLDLLSDVILMMEALTPKESPGSSGHSEDSQCAVPNYSSSAANSSVPPDTDSTITMPTAAQVDKTNMLPEEGLENKTMNKVAVIDSPMSNDLLINASVWDDSAYAACKSKEHHSGASYSSLAKSEAAFVPFGDQSHVLDALEMCKVQVEEYDKNCPKVYLDPLLIVKKEVISTEFDNNIAVSSDTADLSADHCLDNTKAASSGEDSSRHSKSGNSIGKSSRGLTTKSSSKSSFRSCKMSLKGIKSKTMCFACSLISSNFNQESRTGKGSADNSDMNCEVCGHAVSITSNLSSHRHLSNLTVFSEDPTESHNVELPLVSPLGCRSSFSCNASIKSETISSTKPLNGPIPFSLSITPTAQISPCPPVCQSGQINLPTGDDEDNTIEDDSNSEADDSKPGSSLRKRRLSNLSYSQDWEPPSKLKSDIKKSSYGHTRRMLIHSNGSKPAAHQPLETKLASQMSTESQHLYQSTDTAPASVTTSNSSAVEPHA